MQFVETLITDDQALKIRLALDLILQDPDRYVMTDEERDEYQRLAVFYGVVATDPSRFAPTGKNAQTVKSIVRRVKGPAQPQSRRNRRKMRQERRRAHQKLMRSQRREFAEQYNAAMQTLRSEAEEAGRAAAEVEERFAAEPKVMVLAADGTPVMRGIPASMVVPEPESLDEAPKIILPGTAEALGLVES